MIKRSREAIFPKETQFLVTVLFQQTLVNQWQEGFEQQKDVAADNQLKQHSSAYLLTTDNIDSKIYFVFTLTH